jgi:hypothetical protein
MATSLNGWPVITPALAPLQLRTITIPGTKRALRIAKPAAPLLAAFAADWHRLMPARLKLDTGPVACWCYRQARAANGFSDHASGTALDLRWDVLKADNKRHMTDEELATLRAILSKYVTADGHHVLASGAFWSKDTDEMHTELSQAWDRANGAKRTTTLKDVQQVIERLHIAPDGTRPI